MLNKEFSLAQTVAAVLLPLREDAQIKNYLLRPEARGPIIQQAGVAVRAFPEAKILNCF